MARTYSSATASTWSIGGIPANPGYDMELSTVTVMMTLSKACS
ncbi:hypothetical protein [Actinocatenispora rupis]